MHLKNQSKNQLLEVEDEIQNNISDKVIREKINADLLLANQNFLALTNKDKFKIQYARENYICANNKSS